MKIIIVGDGKMGFALSQKLSGEGHDIVMIDENPDVLRLSSNTQDVGCICGNGVDIDIQKEAGVSTADLMIAVTSRDEVNIICCLLAKKLGARHTIARVRGPEYIKSTLFMREELGLSLSVNPEMAAAAEISRILRFPSAMKVDFFSKGKVEIVEFRVGPGSPLNGVALRDLQARFKVKVLVCAVQRGDAVQIPGGSFTLQEEDLVSITGAPPDINQFFRNTGLLAQKTRTGIRVKVVEIDPQRCETLAEALPKAMIIQGDGSDRELLQEEGIDDVDALAALTGLDEENVVVSMYARSRGVGKVITKINHISFGEILGKAGIECVVTPHMIAANFILRYVRAMQNAPGSRVEALSRIIGGRAEAVEFRANQDFAGIQLPLCKLRLKKDLLVACIIRDNRVIFPSGNDCIQPRDGVIVVTTRETLEGLNDILA